MVTMSAVHEQMQERTRQQKYVRQRVQDVRSVLGYQIHSGDQQNHQENLP
jgi:hypothetical protein